MISSSERLLVATVVWGGVWNVQTGATDKKGRGFIKNQARRQEAVASRDKPHDSNVAVSPIHSTDVSVFNAFKILALLLAEVDRFLTKICIRAQARQPAAEPARGESPGTGKPLDARSGG